MSDNYAIEIRDLCKSFGGAAVVQHLNLPVQKGEIFSLLGPNGAGKSTTISMLSCLLKPTSGDALIMGHSITREQNAVKACIGVVPQDLALYADLSARENLTFWGILYGLSGQALTRRVDQVLEMIELTGRQKEAVGKFSGGMKRRVNIGIALLHQPQVLILDEPTVGIDPQSRRHILDQVKALNQLGMTVLYTTHYMEEAQELSSHIAIMDQGKIIACGTHDELVQLVGEFDRVDLTLSVESAQVVEQWRAAEGVRRVSAQDGHVTLLVDDSNFALPQLFEAAMRSGTRITSVQIEEPNLEAVFMHLTGRALRE